MIENQLNPPNPPATTVGILVDTFVFATLRAEVVEVGRDGSRWVVSYSLTRWFEVVRGGLGRKEILGPPHEVVRGLLLRGERRHPPPPPPPPVPRHGDAVGNSSGSRPYSSCRGAPALRPGRT